MHNRFLITVLIALLAAFGTTVPAGPVHAMTAEQYFADGNRLFREDLYWAALLRYRQAGEEGMNTPLLHYNTGIAHYRAGQHIRARDSLLKALDEPTLRVAAQYAIKIATKNCKSMRSLPSRESARHAKSLTTMKYV